MQEDMVTDCGTLVRVGRLMWSREFAEKTRLGWGFWWKST